MGNDGEHVEECRHEIVGGECKVCGKEECQRCKGVGRDRRTLWMACLYDMNELHLPFTECAIEGRCRPRSGTKKLSIGLRVPEWGEPRGDPSLRAFFTLRVCKDCRADWMGAIKTWFKNPPEAQGE